MNFRSHMQGPREDSLCVTKCGIEVWDMEDFSFCLLLRPNRRKKMKCLRISLLCAMALVLCPRGVFGDNAESESFMQWFREKHGEEVFETASGVLCRVLQETKPNGKMPSNEKSLVRMHFEGRLPDDVVFDSTMQEGKEPGLFSLHQLILGWREVVLMMKEGDQWEVVIPSTLAYGEKGIDGKIPADSALIFQVELIEVDPSLSLSETAAFYASQTVPGLPIKLNFAQLGLILVYITFRIYFKSRMRPRGVAAGTRDQAQAPPPPTASQNNSNVEPKKSK